MPINYLKSIQLEEFNEDGYRISPSKKTEWCIEGFYVFSKDPNEHTHLIFNDGFPVLVFLQNRDDSVTVTGKSSSYEIKGSWASAGSIKNVYVRYNETTEQVFIVRFHPGAFYQLFGLDAQYFRRQPVAAFDPIATQSNFHLTDFFERNSIDGKIAYVEEYILNYLRRDIPVILHQTLAYIHKTKGQGTVRNVANDAGVNYKSLERSFVKNIGLLPKEYIQLQRFIHAYLDLVGTADVDLMRIAISNGYYDSNHFLKDFKAYTGQTPLSYLKFNSARH